MSLAALTTLLLTLGLTHAASLSGRVVSYSDGHLVAAATSVTAQGEHGPLNVVDDPADNFTDTPASVLFLNTTSRQWGVRLGSASIPTVPEAVVTHENSVYLVCNTSTPTLYKYETINDAPHRVYAVELGSSGDTFNFMAAIPSTHGKCARLFIAATLQPGSNLLPKNTADQRISVITLDACTGAVIAPIIALVAMPRLTGVQMLERVHGLSVTDKAVYIATQLVRVTNFNGQRRTTANPVVHRMDIGSGDVKTRIMSVTDCASVRIHVGLHVHIAIDRHAGIIDKSEGNDAVEIYRLNAETLGNLKWGTSSNAVDVLQPFSAKLPLRSSDRWTRVVSIGFISKSKTLAILLQTTENNEVWDSVKDTAPVLDFNFPTKARMMILSDSVRTTNQTTKSDAISETPVPEETKEPVTVAFPELSLRQSTQVGPIARPILLLVDENAVISKRIYDILNTTTSSPIIPSAEIPKSGSTAALRVSEMAVDGPGDRAYIIGSVIETGKDDRLLYLNVSLSSHTISTPSVSPSPIGNGSAMECIGASSRTFEGRSVMALISLNQDLHMQKHVRRWWMCCKSWMYRIIGSPYKSGQDGCEKPRDVDMLCYEWVPRGAEVNKKTVPEEKGRLCATPNHVLVFDGKMTYMRDFCNYPATKRCSVDKDTPVNFKGDCGQHIVVANDLMLTQHVGDIEKETAAEAADRECRAIRSSKLLWKVRTM